MQRVRRSALASVNRPDSLGVVCPGFCAVGIVESRVVGARKCVVSGGREPPPPALLEPYVTVSRHTAPTVRRWVEARRCQ